MMLRLESVSTDTSDFWRPRLNAVLHAPPLAPGLYRFELVTTLPAYGTLRLILHDWPAPMAVSLDREGDCRYAKAFSVPRPIARLELELEPHLEAAAVVSVGLEPVGLARLLNGRRDVLRQLAAPRALARKLGQVISGRSGLAFASGAARPDESAIYAAWRAAFEGGDERARIAAALRELHAAVARLPDTRAELRLLMAGDPAIASLPPNPADAGGIDVAWQAADPGAALLGDVLDAAERAEALALVIVDRPGRWSALAPAMIAVELLRHPHCIAVTGDCDRMDSAGRRTKPRFKPGWSPRYQQAADYVGGAVAFRVGPALRELAARVGASAVTNRVLLDLLAADTAIADGVVRHVPRMFFHAAADAPRLHAPPPTRRAAPGGSRPSVSVVMPSRDNADLLRQAVRCVLVEPSVDLELIVVDNGSEGRAQRALLKELERDPRVRVIFDPRPFNFSALVNAGAGVSRGEVLVLLNDDVEAVAPGWLGPLVDVAAEPSAGCVGALLLYPSGRIQHAGVVLGTFGIAGHVWRGLELAAPVAPERLAAVHEVGAVTGACLAVRREVFEAAGGFDPGLPVTLNDVDFCLRVRAKGWVNLMAPHVRLRHHELASRGLDTTPAQAERLARETALFLAKWGDAALRDPFYSPHLTLGREDGSPRDI